MREQLRDIQDAWKQITWTGVGNDLTGKADRCDVQAIDNILSDLK
jgi:hypothetical protein